MTRPDPWGYLRGRPDIVVRWVDLPGRMRGCTDGERTIWLDRGLLQRERRCTLVHELVHLRHHHVGHQPKAVEDSVRLETALLMLPDIEDIVDALRWAGTLGEAAEELWVADDVLEARLAHLNEAERRRLAALAETDERMAS
jgi:hypothetical protein